jgi:hypothetical protein
LSAHTIRSVRLRRRVKPVVAGRRHEEFDKRPTCVRRRLIGVLTCCDCSAGRHAERTEHGASAREQCELRDTGHGGWAEAAETKKTNTKSKREQRIRTTRENNNRRPAQVTNAHINAKDGPHMCPSLPMITRRAKVLSEEERRRRPRHSEQGILPQKET